MSNNFYPLTANQGGPEEREAINRVLDSGQFTMADEVAQFEREFSDYHGMTYGVMTNSGSSANLIAVASLFFKQDRPLKRGDELIVPALAWSTTYAPLQQHGLRLRVMDIDKDTLSMADARAEEGNAMAVVGVSILGNPHNQLYLTTDQYFIEDNCESLDARHPTLGNQTGTSGLVNTFSFFHSHHISCGEGGMVLTNDEELFEILKALRAHGWDRDASVLLSPTESYRFVMPGYNVRPTEIAAAVGREQLKKLPAMTAARRKNLALYQQLFGNDPRWRIQKENGKSSAFAFTFVVPNTPRQLIWNKLEAAGIGHRMITGGCFTAHPAAKYYDYATVGDLPNAREVHYSGFFVGNHPFPLDEQLHKLYEIMNEVCR